MTAHKPLMISRLILIGLLIAACGPDTATYIVQSKPVGSPTVAYYAMAPRWPAAPRQLRRRAFRIGVPGVSSTWIPDPKDRVMALRQTT